MQKIGNNIQIDINSLHTNFNNILIGGNAIIYTRISTPGQINGTSLDSQMQLCVDYCNNNGYNIIDKIKEVSTATNINKQKLLLKITSTENINLIILEPSRLSRNVVDFVKLWDICKKNNIIIHFVQDNLISNSIIDMKQIVSKVFDSQNESIIIGSRIKRSIAYRKRNKLYYPSISKYGYKYNKELHKIEPDYNEQQIIQLIKSLYFGDTFKNIEKSIFSICNKKHSLCFMNDDKVKKLYYGNMTYSSISRFLNGIQLYKRNKKWYPTNISSIIKSN